MSEQNRNEVQEVLTEMNKLFLEGKYSNLSIINAASTLSVHLAIMFGISREEYLRDMQIMFDERKNKTDETIQ